MTAITVVGPKRVTFDRQRAIAGIFVMLGLVDIFVFGLLADKGDAVFTFTLTGAAVNVPNLSLAPGPRVGGTAAPFRSSSASSMRGSASRRSRRAPRGAA